MGPSDGCIWSTSCFIARARGELYDRLRASNLARQWRRVLLPPGVTSVGPTNGIEAFLAESFGRNQPYNELIADLIRINSPADAGGYFVQLGMLPENLAGNLSRVALGTRIECAQCHDHPFADWKQSDFWGLAAYYGDLGRPAMGEQPMAPNRPGEISYEGEIYHAKPLVLVRADSTESESDRVVSGASARIRLATWMTSPDNPSFTATAANRIWQHLVGRGLYRDLENLDQASPADRALVDRVGRKFASMGFDTRRLMAAICMTDWYQAESETEKVPPETDLTESFVRQFKALSPDQVFDSLEQSLQLPVGRINSDAARFSGDRSQLVSRLSETVGATPEDYAAGIPQALLLMNGKMTSDAIGWEQSQLLRSVLESPFFNDADRIDTLFMAVLTRRPSDAERDALMQYVSAAQTLTATPASAAATGMPPGPSVDQSTIPSKGRVSQHQAAAFGEILWALLNSPEFVLCR